MICYFFEACTIGEFYVVEGGAPAKQQRMITDDIVFHNRDTEGVEAPTLDLMVITLESGRQLCIEFG